MANILIGFLIVCFLAVIIMLALDSGAKKKEDDRPIILGNNYPQRDKQRIETVSTDQSVRTSTEERVARLMRYVVWGEKYRVDVVGESFYQDNLLSIVGKKGKTSVNLQKAAVIIHEPDNQYDSNAHAVIIDGKKVGHISKASSAKLVQEKRRLGISDCLIACPAIINGGWKDSSSEGNFGVKLDFPPIAKIGSVLSEKSLDDSLEKFESLKK